MTATRLLLLALPALVVAACTNTAATGGNGDDTVATAPINAATPPKGQQWTDKVVKTPEGGMLMGNPDAPIKLVEYGSRTCPHCAKFDAEGLPKLKSGYIATGKVSYEFRDFPVHGPLDIAPILLGGCVGTDAFFPVLDQMMTNQDKLLAKAQTLPQDELVKIQSDPVKLGTYLAERLGYLDFMKQRGLTEDRARSCLADRKAIDRIASMTDTANTKFDIKGTPTFIVNGDKIDAGEWPGVEAALKKAGA